MKYVIEVSPECREVAQKADIGDGVCWKRPLEEEPSGRNTFNKHQVPLSSKSGTPGVNKAEKYSCPCDICLLGE